MRGFRAGIVVGVVVGLLALPAWASADWNAEWGPLATEGPVWWTECSRATGGYGMHDPCEDLVQMKHFFVTNLEITEIASTGVAVVGYVKPIADAPVTYWELFVSTEPLCRIWQDTEYWICDEEHQTKPTRIASGEIVGGNPEELVTVTGSTTGTPGPVQVYTENKVGPIELIPDRAYRAEIVENERTPQETKEVDPRGENEQRWGSGQVTLITAPKTAELPIAQGEKAKKHAHNEAKRKRTEEKRVKKEEHAQRKR